MNNDNKSLPSVMFERLFNGILKENPTFVLLLGMCPTLAVTTSAVNGLGMGLSTMVVLALSNMLISALRNIIPNKVRIPSFIVIIASFVTIVELLLKAYIPFLYDNLGLYIPLIVVNCIILGRAEAYAYSNPVLPSLFDGLGMGLGFSLALTIIGGVREILGAGEIFGIHIMPASYIPVSIFVMAPGAFFVLAILTAIQNAVKIAGEKKGKDMSKIQSGCGGNCLECEKDCKKPELVKNTDRSAKKAEKADKKKDKKEKVKNTEKESESVETKENKPVNDEKVSSDKKNNEDNKSSDNKSEETKVSEIKSEDSNSSIDKKVVEEVKPSDESNDSSIAGDTKEKNSTEEIFDNNSVSTEAVSTEGESSSADISKNESETVAEEVIAKETEAVSEEISTNSNESTTEIESAAEESVTEQFSSEKSDSENEKPAAEESLSNEADLSAENMKEIEKIISEIESREEKEQIFEESEEVILLASEDDEVFELIDIDDYKKAIDTKKNSAKSRKPIRNKGNKNKAKEMLLKAEKTVKGEDDK